MKRFERGCAVLLLLLLGASGWLVFRYRAGTARIGSIPLAQLPPAQRRQRRVEARTLENQTLNLVRSAHDHESRPFTITATEDQLNTLLQDRLKIENLPLRDPRVELRPGILAMQADVRYNGFNTSATMEGTLRAQNGHLQSQIESLQVAGLNAPGGWKRKLEESVAPKLNELLNNAPGRVESVQIEEDRVTFKGNTD